MKRVLVTGALGYVGSVLVPHLLGKGLAVEGLDTGFFQDCALFPPTDVPVRRADLRKVTAGELRGFDAIVHLGALSNDPLGELNEELTYAINRDATVRLAQAAREAGVQRFVFASSCSVYGLGTSAPRTETDPLDPQTAYARSKVASEGPILALANERFTPVGMRFATAYGLAPRLRLDIVVNNLVGWAVTTGRIVLQSDGTPWRPLVHVEDMASTMAAVLFAPAQAVAGHVFNVGREEDTVQVRDIAAMVRDRVHGSSVELSPQASPDTRSYRVSFEKLRRHLPEHRLSWDLGRGIAQLVDGYREHGMNEALFTGRKFVRLRQLKHLLETQAIDNELYWRHA